jgi:hypothetical protein
MSISGIDTIGLVGRGRKCDGAGRSFRDCDRFPCIDVLTIVRLGDRGGGAGIVAVLARARPPVESSLGWMRSALSPRKHVCEGRGRSSIPASNLQVRTFSPQRAGEMRQIFRSNYFLTHRRMRCRCARNIPDALQNRSREEPRHISHREAGPPSVSAGPYC